MSNMQTITHDRTIAIRQALSTFLDASQVSEALRLWQEKYASEPTFSVQYFARECCILFGVESQRTQLIKSLVRELYMQKVSTDGQGKAVMPGGPQASAAAQVFQQLLVELVNSAGGMQARNITHFVEAGLARTGLDAASLPLVQHWLRQGGTNLKIALPQQVMVKIINLAYIGLCEFVGPIKADQLLHEAVCRVASSRHGKLFHPEQLL